MLLWAVCSVCQGKGSAMQKLQELETRVQLMVHQQQMYKLLMDEKDRLIEHLQKELLEVKLERDKLQQTMEKQSVEQLQGAESKHAPLESHLQPPQFENLPENLNKGDSHSSESSEFDSGAVSFKYPYAFKEFLRHIDKVSGKNDENDFGVRLVDYTEATNDCVWTDCM